MHPVLSLLPLILVGSAEESVKKFKLSHKVSIHMLGRHGVDRMCVYRSMLAYLCVFVLVVDVVAVVLSLLLPVTSFHNGQS